MTHRRHQRGVSLVEMLVAMGMSATVLGGAVAAIGLGGQTFRAATDGIQSAGAIDALSRMSADIQLALDFTERTARATTFWVPDRTGDGAPELIRYAWSGTPREPVTFSMNGSTPVAVLPSVTDISFEYLVSTVQGQAMFATTVPPPPADEIVFERAYTGTGTTHALGSTSSVAAIIEPELPAGGSTFRVTRVRIPISKAGNGTETLTVSLHRVSMTTGTPTGNALASVSIRQSDLPATMTPVEFDLDSAITFAAGDFIAIVVSQNSSSSVGNVALEPSPQHVTDGWIATTNAAGAWAINATKDIPLMVYSEIDPGS